MINQNWQAVLFVRPFGKERPRLGKYNNTYTPSKTKQNEAELKIWICQNKPPRFKGPLKVIINFCLARPATKEGRLRKYPNVKPDLDNMIKTILDAGNGLIWNDDNQIIKIEATKTYSLPERIEISVEEL